MTREILKTAGAIALFVGLIAAMGCAWTHGATTSGTVSGICRANTATGPGVTGVKLYLDLNNDSRLDGGEPTATTDSTGVYTFANVQPISNVVVREILPAGESQLAPLEGGVHVGVTAGQTSIANWIEKVPVATTMAATPAAVIATPVTYPAPVLGINGVLPAEAPAAIHCSALACLPAGADWRQHAISVTCRDSLGNVVDSHPGPWGYALCVNPGTYTYTAVIDGVATSATFSLNPDTRTPVYLDPVNGLDANSGVDPAHAVKTLSRFSGLLERGHAFGHLPYGCGDLRGVLDLYEATNDVVDAYGDATKPYPIIYGSGNLFSGSVDSANLVIRHLRFDCPYTVTAAHSAYAYHDGSGALGNLHGTNLAFDHIEIGPLYLGFNFQGVNGAFLNYIAGVDPTGTQGQMILNTGDLPNSVWAHIVSNGAVTQSALRTTGFTDKNGTHGMSDSLIYDVAVTEPAGAGISEFEMRQAQDVLVEKMTLNGQALSCDEGDTGSYVHHCLFDTLTLTNSTLTIKNAVTDCIFQNGTITHTDGNPCVSATVDAESNNLLKNIALAGPKGIECWSAGPLWYSNVTTTPGVPMAYQMAGGVAATQPSN